jgi:predicted O-methyltransferase YrrM
MSKTSTRNREGLPIILNWIKAKRGVEVGVYEGRFSKLMLERCDLDMLSSIDPWLNADGDFDDVVYEKAVTRLAPYEDHSKLIIDRSPEAAHAFEDKSLDFVFIDGEHSYEATKADMEAWLPKVKPGGILAGHDYANRGNSICKRFITDDEQQGRKRVKKAVRTFIAEADKEYTLNLIAEASIVWWFFV